MQNKKYLPPAETDKQAKSACDRAIAAKRFLGARAITTKQVKAGSFRLTSEELSAISKKGADLLLNATPEDMNNYRKWQ